MAGIIRRGGDPATRAKAYKSLALVGSLKAEYNTTKTEVYRLESNLEGEKVKLKGIQETLNRTRNDLMASEEEIDCDPLPEGAQPVKRIQRRDKLRLQTGQLEVALGVQVKAVEAATKAVAAAERKLFEADKNLSKFVDEIEETEAAIEVQATLDRERAEKLAQREKQRAKRWEKEQRLAMETKAQQIQELSALATQQINTAKNANKQAVKKARAALDHTKSVIDKITEHKHAVHESRINAVLELKQNTGVVFDELKNLADKNRMKVEQDRQQLESEKESMISKGLNPYVEFRQRQFDIEGKNRERRMLNAVEENKSALAETMILEEEHARREEIQNRRNYQHEKKYRDELGRHVVEGRIKTYINTITADHVDVLDPTSKATRIDPSKITDIPDYSFGLGKSSRIPAENMKRITENIRNKLQVSADEVGEYDRLLSAYKDLRVTSQSADNKKRRKKAKFEDEIPTSPKGQSSKEIKDLDSARNEMKMLANATGVMPGTDNSTVNVNLPHGEAERTKLLKVVEEEIGDNLNGSTEINSDIHKYPTVTLTKFEKDCFENAKNEQKSRLTQGVEQIAGGRLFEGKGFVSKPAILLFKDFEVGQVYKKRFVLTNASYTFNSFRLLNLSDNVIDFFNIVFEKPGRVSAGVSCPLDITFTPKVNQDIFTNLKFLTETGPVEVPIQCLIKRCAPVVLNPRIDFDTVVIGQVVTIPLQIKDTEALPSSVSIRRKVIPNKPLMVAQPGRLMTLKDLPLEDMLDPGDDALVASGNEGPQLITKEEIIDSIMSCDECLNEEELWSRVKRIMTAVLQQKKTENPCPLDIHPDTAVVKGYGETSVDVVCAPLIVGEADQEFEVIFHQVDESMKTVDGNNQLVKKHVSVDVKVASADVPIYVSEEVLEMKCCLLDRIYRTRVELKSRAKAAFRVDMKIAAPLNQYVEVNPAMLFVQAGGSQLINIKFTPTVDIMHDLKPLLMRYEGFNNAAKFALPIEMKVVTQDLPLYFVLTGDVSEAALEISTKVLDFGPSYISQSSTLPLTITNTCMLAQKVAFVRLPPEIMVEPNDGFCLLLPGESTTFQIGFSPKTAVAYNFNLTMMTSSNDVYPIQIIGKGMELPLTFSSPVVKMRTTCPGERVLESCLVQNTTHSEQCCEIVQPDASFSWLKISPSVVDLQPGESCRLDIEYCPPVELIGLKPKEWHDELVKKKQESTCEDPIEEVNTESNPVPDTELYKITPFTEWEDDGLWSVARGMYGSMQWSNPPVGAQEGNLGESPSGSRRGSEVNETTKVAEESIEEPDEPDAEELSLENEEDEEKYLPASEWGIIGNWKIPVLFRPKKTHRSTIASNGHMLSSPMFMEVQTAVVRAQLDCDVKYIDFGQMAIGKRTLKRVVIRNNTDEYISLQSNPVNAVGPFSVVNAIRGIPAGGYRTLTIECNPKRPGLTIEILEIFSSQGGHRIRLTLKTQGVEPIVELSGLEPALDPSWSPMGGILNFGNVVTGDVCIKKFAILNKSAFPVHATITRSTCDGLPHLKQVNFIEKATNGLPLFVIKPEKVRIDPSESCNIEIMFHPDRGRDVPFREDLNIFVGQTDGVIQVCVCGRAWDRQMFVVPTDPMDEPFSRVPHPLAGSDIPTLPPPGYAIETSIVSAVPPLPPATQIPSIVHDTATKIDSALMQVEDKYRTHQDIRVRELQKEVYKELNLSLRNFPSITLEYPDLFGASINENEYVEFAVGSKGPKGDVKVLSRQMTRQLTIGSSVIHDQREKSTSPGTFEVILNQETKDCNLFSLQTEKGSVNPGSNVVIDIMCLLQEPKGIGGLKVGSWQSYRGVVVLKGGWVLSGHEEEIQIPFVLKAFVRL